MTPTVLRSGPEAVPPAPQRERASEPSGDFAALFGALRRAEPPRLPEPPRNEPPRAAAPAVPDRPVDEAPRAELPAAPESADKPLRPRHPRQPAPAGLPETGAGAAPAGDADHLLAQPAAVVDQVLTAALDKDEAPSDPTALPTSGLPSSPIEIATPAGLMAEESGEAMAKPVAAASGQAGQVGQAAPMDSTDASQIPAAAKPAEPVATPTALPSGAEAALRTSPGSQEPSSLRSAEALPALPALPGGQAIAAPSAAAAPGPAQAALALPPQHPGFAEELGAQLSVWTRQGVQQAELRLNPAELGPVQVRIQIEGQQALVRFVADAAPTRDALEAAMPELAAALQREGLQLSGGSVQSQAQHQHQQQQRDSAAASIASGRGPRGQDAAGAVASSPQPRPASQRLLDLYA